MTERFTLLEQIGRGGMGVVWKARNGETGEIIAIKLLHDVFREDPDYVARLEREVDIARRIDSPHVVKVLGYGRLAGAPYMAMEFIDGPSLRDVLKERGTLPWEEANRILREVAEGLAAVHAANVIHRDIKPSNILIAPDGTAKLADFGIARANDLTRMTSSMTMLGTVAYMSPDVVTSEQSDLYALGCMLYEMLAGVPPYVGDSQQEVLMQHLRDTPDVGRLPAESRRMAGWLLEKDPARRAPSAAAVAAVLRGTSKYGPEVARRERRRWQVAAWVGVPCLVAVGGIGAVLASSRSDAPQSAGAVATATGTPTTTGAIATATAPGSVGTVSGYSPTATSFATTPTAIPQTPRPATPLAATSTLPTPTRTAPPTPTPTLPPTVPPTPTSMPPTPTPPPRVELPTAPGSLSYCGPGCVAWQDRSDNEDGFRVYVNGNLAATTGPNASSSSVNVQMSSGFTYCYAVESFNAAGHSARTGGVCFEPR